MNKKMIVLPLCLVLLLTACSNPNNTVGQEGETKETGSIGTTSIETASMESSAGTDDLQKSDDNGDDPEHVDSSYVNNAALYKDVLDSYYQALYEHQTYPDQWEPDKYCTEKGLVYSIINPYWAWENTSDILMKEGFAFLDLNEDGTDELVIGWVGNEFWNMDDGYVFAIYTIIDGEVTLAIEGWERSKYVIGDSNYLYSDESGSAWEAGYVKYRFSLDDSDFLEPIEKLYSQMDSNDDYWWEYIINPEDIGVIEYTGKHEDLLIDMDEAEAISKTWFESGIAIDYTIFDEYIVSE